MNSQNPIGVFDSGVGGLTVAKALNNLLPNENLIYFGDTVHLPYGDKSVAAIQKYSLAIADFLINQKNAKAILIACNSASAVAYDLLVAEFGTQVPIFNVIDPVVNFVSLTAEAKTVGIIGTRATISSQTYSKKIRLLNPKITVNSLATPLLVPVIEEGLSSSNISNEIIEHYLQNPKIKNVDTLVLGCTHYPLIQNQVEKLGNQKMSVINSPEIVAQNVKAELENLEILNPSATTGQLQFLISDYTPVFENIAQIMFGKNVDLEEHKI